ncbi:T-cell differentiation antigen CD6-like [Electrophorus electricus]|uniref:T-cell differentiation antigen CD6-like n=1 Tax=Electrophorus electricus TaxID=8005 RepID=UPI0015D0BB50|nr:T-cell differentiation antigen CD6-like [Electrophorus electricus]
MEPVLMVAALHALCLCQGLQGAPDSSNGNRTEPVMSDKPVFKHSGSYILSLSQACSGTLGTLHQGRWIALSLKRLSTEDIRPLAHQACENLGCGGFFSVTDNGTAPSNSCLTDCIIRNSTVHNCTEDPLSECVQTVEVVCEHQAIRLAAGNDRCAGRVELRHGGQWGSVCDDDWDLREGNVVCAQLGCGTAVIVTVEAVAFGPGTGPININKLNCTGTENNLWQCSTQKPSHRDFCGHKEDAGVVCSESVNVPVTLTPIELSKTNWTTEFLMEVAAKDHRSRFSALALSCIGLSIALLLLLISNIGTCTYYRGRNNEFLIYERQSNSHTSVGLQRGEPRNSNSLHAVTAQMAEDGGLAVRRSSQNDSSDTSSDLDYEHYYHCNIQPPVAVNFSSDVLDSKSTSSGEGYENSQTERQKLFDEALDDAAVVGKCFQAQGKLCTEGNALESTRSCSVLDSESTSSGECYENPPTEGEDLGNPGVNKIYLEHSLQMLPLHSTSEQAKRELVDSNDSDSTSSGECYENTGIDAANLLETLERSPSLLVQPLLCHHTPQLTGDCSLPQPRSPTEGDSSTSSEEAYENVPIDNMSGLGASEQQTQSSSDSDYDDVANWSQV